MSFRPFYPEFGFSEPHIVVLFRTSKFSLLWHDAENRGLDFWENHRFFLQNCRKNCHFTLFGKIAAEVPKMVWKVYFFLFCFKYVILDQNNQKDRDVNLLNLIFSKLCMRSKKRLPPKIGCFWLFFQWKSAKIAMMIV